MSRELTYAKRVLVTTVLRIDLRRTRIEAETPSQRSNNSGKR